MSTVPITLLWEGLRIFAAEGWGGEEIYRNMPIEMRRLFRSKIRRPWNTIQQRQGREAKFQRAEDGLPPITAGETTSGAADVLINSPEYSAMSDGVEYAEREAE